MVETIGGATVALDFTTRALKAGKSVVSSNKELVATHGYELLQLAREHGVSYLFEASVGGGIPILRPLTSCLAANELSQVTGILNGTTNYILTRMIKAGLTFDQALKEAQDNGYAEKDPTADVDGHDACRKICILAALAFGQHVYPDQVPTQGIRGVTLADVAYADSCGYKIKLLGRAIREPEGKLCAFVAPHLVPASNPLSGVEDVFNAISVTGNAIGDVMFYGRGAGKLPTASAVVGDVIDIAKDLKTARCAVWGPGSRDLVGSDILSSRWYVRGRPPWTKSGPPSGRSAPGKGRCACRGDRFPDRTHDGAPSPGQAGGGWSSTPLSGCWSEERRRHRMVCRVLRADRELTFRGKQIYGIDRTKIRRQLRRRHGPHPECGPDHHGDISQRKQRGGGPVRPGGHHR